MATSDIEEAGEDEFKPDVLHAEMERIREEQYAAHFRDQRSWTGNAFLALLAALLAAVTLVPRVEEALDLSFEVAAPVLGAFVVITMIATISAKRYGGVLGRAHRLVERIETVVTGLVGAVFIYASGSALSIFWFIPLAQVVQNLPFQGLYRWFTVYVFLVLHGLVAIAFWISGSPTDAVLTVFFSGVIILIARTVIRFSDNMIEAKARENLLRRRLERAKVVQERKRIARDIHDGVGADLTALVWHARRLAAEESAGELDDFVGRVRETLHHLRGMVSDLKRPTTTLADVEAELQSRLDGLFGEHIDVELSRRGDAAVSGQMTEAIIRSVDEAVRNAIEHGDAESVDVDINAEENWLEVHVEDDGRGCPPDILETTTGGLNHMRERAEKLSGKLDLERMTTGTRLSLQLPLDAEAEPSEEAPMRSP